MTAQTSLTPPGHPTGQDAIVLPERLDMASTGRVWRETQARLDASGPGALVIEAAPLTFADSAGLAFLLRLRRLAADSPGRVDLRGLHPDIAAQLTYFTPQAPTPPERFERPRSNCCEEMGRAALAVWSDIRSILTFVGELGCALLRAARHPRSIRGRDAVRTAEAVGVNAFFIIVLIGFLMGLIMSFQSAMPLRQFGAEIYVANFLGLSMLRELGPLVTAILLAGRSGSSFAAELGTMKVNEEINALDTMGLDPVSFLVVPRVLATMAMTPLLVLFFNLAGLIGGAVVMLSLGYPTLTYARQVVASVGLGDFAGGLFKAVIFSLLVAGIGCLRGLRAGTGARAVGEATTSAVVSGIILIAVTDGIFAVTFYALGI